MRAMIDECTLSDPHSLHYAVKHHYLNPHSSKVSDLIAAGFDVNRGYRPGAGENYIEAGDTPLHIAARMREFEMIALLLRHGANPNALNCHDATPLHRLVSSDRIYGPPEVTGARQCVELLIKAGANRSARNADNRTALEEWELFEVWRKRQRETFSKESRKNKGRQLPDNEMQQFGEVAVLLGRKRMSLWSRLFG